MVKIRIEFRDEEDGNLIERFEIEEGGIELFMEQFINNHLGVLLEDYIFENYDEQVGQMNFVGDLPGPNSNRLIIEADITFLAEFNANQFREWWNENRIDLAPVDDIPLFAVDVAIIPQQQAGKRRKNVGKTISGKRRSSKTTGRKTKGRKRRSSQKRHV